MKSLPALVILIAFASLASAQEEKPDLMEEYAARSAVAGEWLFRELPRHLGNDMKETFWNPWHLLGLAVGSGLALGVHEVDPEIQREFHPQDVMGGSRRVLNFMGQSFVLGGSTLLATGVAKLADRPQAAWTAGTMLESLTVTYGLTYLLKLSTQRRRPDGSNDLSLPSGHAAGSFALATVTEIFYGPLYGVPSYALATAISLARIDSNKHVASDTIAGALLGTLVGLGTAKFHRGKKPDLFVHPTVLSSGGTLNLTRVF